MLWWQTHVFPTMRRLGHDLIGNTIGRFEIAEGFNAEDFYLVKSGPPSAPTATFRDDAEQDFSDIMQALSTTPANEIDGKLSDALRNLLFAEGEDLAGRNIFRGRELGLPTYAGMAECFGVSPDATVCLPSSCVITSILTNTVSFPYAAYAVLCDTA